jgi:hypothetical protein
MFSALVEESTKNTVQSRAEGGIVHGLPLLLALSSGNNLLPGWWSPARDRALRNFWKKSDHLSGAMYNMIAKMTAIPFSAVPKDYTDTTLVEEAEQETERLQDGAEFGEGWITFYSKTLEDMLGTDNGWFAEIIGAGDPAGPIIGQAITVAHLDSYRCQRTADPIYPVLYMDAKGKLYKLHYSRVMYNSQMTSAIDEMLGVGYCAVSRATMAAQNLIDISTYKMEKLGSRPHRELLLTRGGLDPTDMQSAFNLANELNDNQGFSRYSKIVVAGNSAMPEADVKQISFTDLPDGFDERDSVTLGMAVLAMAFGVDARDLFPGLEAGATRADALLAHLKQRGKGPGQIISDIEAQFNRKFLPRSMKMVFDFQDDAEDQQVAEIKNERAQRRERDVEIGVVNTRVAREQMVSDGDLTRKQFEMLELEDGRLLNGTPIIALFHSSEARYKSLLTLEGIENPLDTTTNDPSYVIMQVDKATMNVNEKWLNAKGEEQRMVFQRAAAALEQLKELYIEPKPVETEPGAGKKKAPRLNPTRHENLLAPNTKVELDARTSLTPGKDDGMSSTSTKESTAGDPISRLHQIVAEINATISQANQHPTYIIVPKEKQETPVVNITVPTSEPNIVVNVPQQATPTINPNIVVNVPELKQPSIEIKAAPITVNTPETKPAEITIHMPKSSRIKRAREQQVVHRDASGNMAGTQMVRDYEYEETKE